MKKEKEAGVQGTFNDNFKFFKFKIYGSDAAENRKFETGNAALLGNKNFQHLMFNEKNFFLILKFESFNYTKTKIFERNKIQKQMSCVYQPSTFYLLGSKD